MSRSAGPEAGDVGWTGWGGEARVRVGVLKGCPAIRRDHGPHLPHDRPAPSGPIARDIGDPQPRGRRRASERVSFHCRPPSALLPSPETEPPLVSPRGVSCPLGEKGPPTGTVPNEGGTSEFATQVPPRGELAPFTQYLGTQGLRPMTWASSPLRHRVSTRG